MSVKDLYSSEDFNILLTELGKELQYHSTLSKRFSFCIVGGGALTLAWGMRRMTTDLDVVFNKSHEEDARLVHDCAVRVAKRLGYLPVGATILLHYQVVLLLQYLFIVFRISHLDV